MVSMTSPPRGATALFTCTARGPLNSAQGRQSAHKGGDPYFVQERSSIALLSFLLGCVILSIILPFTYTRTRAPSSMPAPPSLEAARLQSISSLAVSSAGAPAPACAPSSLGTSASLVTMSDGLLMCSRCSMHRRARRYFARETSPLNVGLFIPEGNKLT